MYKNKDLNYGDISMDEWGNIWIQLEDCNICVSSTNDKTWEDWVNSFKKGLFKVWGQ